MYVCGGGGGRPVYARDANVSSRDMGAAELLLGEVRSIDSSRERYSH